MPTVRHLGYFPFCIQEAGPDYNFIIPASLDQAMAIWWKVKKWKITSSCVGYNTESGTDYYWANFSEEYTIARNDNVLNNLGTITTDEGIKPATVKDLVCPQYIVPIQLSSYNSTGSTIGNWSYQIAMFGLEVAVKSGTIYYVRTYANLQSPTTELSISCVKPETDIVVQIGTFTLDTKTGTPCTTPIWMGYNSGLSFTPNAIWNVVMEGVEFYDYSP